MYLMIENAGVADVRSFTKVGLSTARDNADKIGQFGSGTNLGMLCLMRRGLTPRVYCGKTKVEFSVNPNIMGDTDYHDVFVKIGTKAPIEMSYTLEMGALDWDDPAMGLREFISNAIDACETPSDINVEIVNSPRAKDGYTRVFVPVDHTVNQFVGELSKRFLQFTSTDLSARVLPKKVASPVRIYRKGVFVREMEKDGKFDYNFGDELDIDECRNANDHDCKKAIAGALSKDKEAVKIIFHTMVSGEVSAETELDSYYLWKESWWLEVWNEVAGEQYVIVKDTQSILASFILKKHKIPVVVNEQWYNEMQRAGIPTGSSILDVAEESGCETLEPTELATKIRDEVWEWLVDVNLTNEHPKPEIKLFSKVIENGKPMQMGYQMGACIFINKDFQENRQTYLEEIAHYVTGASDGTREFQEFSFQFATRMAEIIYS